MNNQRLDNFDRGVSSADRFLNVISDPRKAIAIVIIVMLIIGLLWLFKSQISSIVSSIKGAINQRQAENEIEQNYGSTSISAAKIAEMANNIHSCFGYLGDNEQQLYNYLSQLGNTADYEALKAAYGNRTCPGIGCSTLHNLEGMINCNLDSSERQQIKAILAQKGIHITQIND
ncbi:MAG: hypothetical protein J6V54_10735 [Bacteroidales bacterium]|nr:hypothetical protein [Bacteroidales bacterium]